MVVPQYSRSALLDWLQNVAPDLRIGKALVEGKRVCFAKFTHAGVEHEVSAESEGPDEEIVRIAVETLRAAMNLPPLFTSDRSVELEQRIVLASLAGDDTACASLTRELVMGRQPRALQAQTRFAKRETW